MHPTLNIAIKAARQAGSIILRSSEDLGSLTINDKGFNDFVSEVDLASENEIIRILKAAYPDHAFPCLPSLYRPSSLWGAFGAPHCVFRSVFGSAFRCVLRWIFRNVFQSAFLTRVSAGTFLASPPRRAVDA